MKHFYPLLLFVIALFTSFMLKAAPIAKVDSELPMSCRMIESEMIRFPHPWMLDFRKSPKWSYTNGFECNAILLAGESYPQFQEKYLAYARAFADTMLLADGSIKGYEIEEFNIDHVAPGPMLLTLYDLTKDEKYLRAAQLLRRQLTVHPRTGDGGFWHKKIYPNQMWLDGLFMAEPFYAEYAFRFGEKEAFDDIAKQIELVAKGTYDAKSGLYRHAFDYTKSAFWADKKDGRSQHVWGRAMGWYLLAMVETLDYFPKEHPKYESILKTLRQVVDGIARCQDKKSGLFYQVLDLPNRKGNYLEATCSSMFAYGIMKAVRMDYLPNSYLPLGRSIYDGIVRQFIKVDAHGVVSLTSCCSVAGLGPDSNKKRDGSFGYYLSEPIRDNDPKGVAPFILAALEVERLSK